MVPINERMSQMFFKAILLAVLTFATACSSNTGKEYATASQAVVPYTVQDLYWDAPNQCWAGSESCPYIMEPNALIAHANHQNDWGKRLNSNDCWEYGQFSTPKTYFGQQKYEWSYRYTYCPN